MAAYTDRELTRCQPILALRITAVKCQFQLVEQRLKILRSQFAIVIKEAVARGGEAAGLRIKRDDLAFPLGAQKIPVGFKLARVHKVCVVSHEVKRGADIHKDVFALWIYKVLSPLPPLRFVFDLGQDKSRSNRVERLTLTKRVRRSVAQSADIGDKFSVPPLGNDSRHMLAAAGSDDGDLDLGKSLLKAALDEYVADLCNAENDRL